MPWNEFMKETAERLERLRREIPDAYAAFEALGAAAKSEGRLDLKTKEYIALGIAIATRCDSCVGFHARALVRLGAPREEFCDASAMCAYMAGGPGVAYSAKALEAYDAFSE